MIDLYLLDCFRGTSFVQKVVAVQSLENKQSSTSIMHTKTSFAVTHSISNQPGARQSCISPMRHFLLDMLVNGCVYGNIPVHTILLKVGNRQHWLRRTACCVADGMSRDSELALSERLQGWNSHHHSVQSQYAFSAISKLNRVMLERL